MAQVENDDIIKIEKGISRIQFKHNNEIQAMELRIENHKNQLLREKANKMYLHCLKIILWYS